MVIHANWLAVDTNKFPFQKALELGKFKLVIHANAKLKEIWINKSLPSDKLSMS